MQTYAKRHTIMRLKFLYTSDPLHQFLTYSMSPADTWGGKGVLYP